MSSTSITRRSKLQRDKTITSFGDGQFEDFDVEESGPVLSSPGSAIPRDIITYKHSYGYNCKKPYNLYLLGKETLVFLSGNYIHFLNTRTLELTIRRSVLGTGIGCMTVKIKNREGGSKKRYLITFLPEKLSSRFPRFSYNR